MKLVYSSWNDCDVIDFAFPQNFKLDAFAEYFCIFFVKNHKYTLCQAILL